MNQGLSEIRKTPIEVERNQFPRWKRTMDVLGGLIGLILFSPVFIIIALLIFLTDGRPIFFRQPRIGWLGETFYIWKFRSMRKNAEEVLKSNREIYRKYVENDYKLPEGEDPRVTSIGRLIRKTSLDELPQFWNVLKGEMSLVGPRPIVPAELEEYQGQKALFLKMKPGITGVWQVSGRSELKYPERATLELSYLNKQNLKYDIAVILKTLYCVFKRDGAFLLFLWFNLGGN